MGLVIFLLLVVWIIVSAVIANKFEAIAALKGHQNYFWWCFLLGLPGWLMVLALPDRKGSGTSATQPDEADSLPEL